MRSPLVRPLSLANGLFRLAVLALAAVRTTRADEAAVVPQSLERAGQPAVQGRLLPDLAGGLKFVPNGDSRPVPLTPGSVVRFHGQEPSSAALPPLFEAQVGQTARISGTLRSVGEREVVLGVAWQAADVRIARPGIQALIQRPGEAGLFAEDFEKLDPARWVVEGRAEAASVGKEPGLRRGLKIAADGASVTHRLAEPLGSGRLELAFFDDGQVVPGGRWTLELAFRGQGGPATLRVLLGWAEESLAVESPEGPSLAVQRLSRTAGWHRLMLRFGPEQTEIAVDGKELAHGRGPAGPLQSIALAASGGAVNAPKGLAGQVAEIQLVRFAEPPASLEIDPTQDEARLAVGDQLFGRILRADLSGLEIDVAGSPTGLNWSEVAGLHFRRDPAAARPIQGAWVRAEWRPMPGETSRELNFAEGAVSALTGTDILLDTPYCGSLSVPQSRLARLKVLEPGWRQVLDPAAHHLGDEVKGPPLALDPPVPEGGVLERGFDLERVEPGPLWLSLDVRDVVGEAGSQFSTLVQKGEIRTHVALNGTRIDSLNRHITTANETPERIRIPLPPERLRAGRNVIRIEQSGTAGDPTAYDDLEILQIAIQRPAGEAVPPPVPRGPVPSP